MRLRRAINDLERGGLLTTWKRYGRHLSNIKLTELGEEIAVFTLARRLMPRYPDFVGDLSP